MGGLAWLTWPKDRLVALVSPAEGRFQTLPLIVRGDEIRLNFTTMVSGIIRVQVQRPDGSVVTGRSFGECDAVGGNELDRLITWKGKTRLGVKEGEAVVLAFRMRHAKLFSVRFVSG